MILKRTYIVNCQVDLEEEKNQEIKKLQSSLEEMRKKVDETNVLLVKEREAAKKAIEEAPPVVTETQVLVEDTQKIEALTEEVEGLKVPPSCPNLNSSGPILEAS